MNINVINHKTYKDTEQTIPFGRKIRVDIHLGDYETDEVYLEGNNIDNIKDNIVAKLREIADTIENIEG